MQAKAMSGKGQFPFLVDPNTGKQMLESDAIISYLYNEYGDGQVTPCLTIEMCVHACLWWVVFTRLGRNDMCTVTDSACCWRVSQANHLPPRRPWLSSCLLMDPAYKGVSPLRTS